MSSNLSVYVQKITVGICILLFSFIAAHANNEEPNTGIIKGQVNTTDGKPAASVTVQLKGTKKVTIPDEDGTFTLHNVQPGSYEIEISLTGFQTVSQTVLVEKNKTQMVVIRLDISDKQLQEVIVTANRKFGAPSSEYVSKMPLKNLENSQVYNHHKRIDERTIGI